MNSPICIFVYKRPQESIELLHALAACDGAAEHEVHIFSDAARSEEDAADVAELRQELRLVNGFRSLRLHEAESNQGLAKSIISGVSSLFQEHTRVIVLEDDLLPARDFLLYMEAALEHFESDKRIWSVSAYAPPLQLPADYSEDLYLTGRASSWGWASWRDRWQSIDWQVSDYANFLRDKEARRRFDEGGNDMGRLLALQQRGKINSWAIRWCYAQFRQGCYSVYPVRSKVINQGFGQSASHAGWHDERHRVELGEAPLRMPAGRLMPDTRILAAFKAQQDLSLISKIGYFMRLHGLGYKKAQSAFKTLLRLLRRQNPAS